MNEHYSTLGVDPGASLDEIRSAYRALARNHHPDRQTLPDERERAERRMAEINQAFAVVGDPARRAAYDGADQPPRVRAPERRFRPFDDSSDEWDQAPWGLGDDPDEGGVPLLSRRLSMAPAVGLAGGLVATVVGGVTGLAPLAVVGLAAVVGSVIGFVAVPLVALSRAARHERDR